MLNWRVLILLPQSTHSSCGMAVFIYLFVGEYITSIVVVLNFKTANYRFAPFYHSQQFTTEKFSLFCVNLISSYFNLLMMP